MQFKMLIKQPKKAFLFFLTIFPTCLMLIFSMPLSSNPIDLFQTKEGKSTLTISATIMATTLAVLYGGYRWLRTPHTELPNLDQLNVVSFLPVERTDLDSKDIIQSGNSKEIKKLLRQKNINAILLINNQLFKVQNNIPDDIKNHSHVSIYSRGCSLKGASSTYIALKVGTINGACISFDYDVTDTLKAFNFCQKQDLHCLDLVYKGLLAKNPNAQVLLHGLCKGGTNILRYIAEKTEQSKQNELSNIKAIIIESPPISVEKIICNYPGFPLSHSFLRLILPNYDYQAKTILDAQKMPSNIPLLIGRIKVDKICTYEETSNLVKHLNKIGCKDNLWLFTSQEKVGHAFMGKAQDLRQTVNAFLKQNGFPFHSQNNDEEASNMLKKAQEEAQTLLIKRLL
ncbi:MAG: hypothetical protein WA432_03090 [Candidatus Babeliaceae bacterium]